MDPVVRWVASSLSLRTSSLLPCPVAMGTPGLESEAWATKTREHSASAFAPRQREPLPFPILNRRLAPPSCGPAPNAGRQFPPGLWGHSAGPSGSDSDAVMRGADGGPDGGGGGCGQCSGTLGRGTHLREEAKEKWAGVLGEKLRGLSRGLLPVAERGGIFRPGAVPSDLLILKARSKPQLVCSLV